MLIHANWPTYASEPPAVSSATVGIVLYISNINV